MIQVKTQIKYNPTRSVKELISGFEDITNTGVSHHHLEKRHVLEFTGSKETYQSPGEKTRLDTIAAAKQGIRSRRNWPARSELLTLPSRPGSSSSSPGSDRGSWTPVSNVSLPISLCWSTSGRGIIITSHRREDGDQVDGFRGYS